MDVGLPSMSGIEATACLRASAASKNIPVIMCSGWMAQKNREAALRIGAQAVINKPVFNGSSADDLAALPAGA
jgi:CheY-like chemotaxis protein